MDRLDRLREVSPVGRYNSAAKAFEKDLSQERTERFNLTPQRAMSLGRSAQHKKEGDSEDSSSDDGRREKSPKQLNRNNVASKFKWAKSNDSMQDAESSGSDFLAICKKLVDIKYFHALYDLQSQARDIVDLLRFNKHQF